MEDSTDVEDSTGVKESTGVEDSTCLEYCTGVEDRGLGGGVERRGTEDSRLMRVEVWTGCW